MFTVYKYEMADEFGQDGVWEEYATAPDVASVLAILQRLFTGMNYSWCSVSVSADSGEFAGLDEELEAYLEQLLKFWNNC